MRGREMTVAILDQVQMLDQQIAPTLALAKERTYFLKGARIDLATLWRARRPASAAALAMFGRHCLRRLGQGHRFLLERKNVNGNRVLRTVCRSLEQADDPAVRPDIDGVCRRDFGQARHGHDLPADSNHELG